MKAKFILIFIFILSHQAEIKEGHISLTKNHYIRMIQADTYQNQQLLSGIKNQVIVNQVGAVVNAMTAIRDDLNATIQKFSKQ